MIGPRSLVVSLAAVGLLATARPGRAQTAPPVDTFARVEAESRASGFDPSAAVAPARVAPAPIALPLPGGSSPSAGRFAGGVLLGTAGSLAGVYAGLISAIADDFSEDHLVRHWTVLGVGTALGSGIPAGALNGSIGRGVLGGVAGFGAGLGTFLVTASMTSDGIGFGHVLLGSAVQALVATAIARTGK